MSNIVATPAKRARKVCLLMLGFLCGCDPLQIVETDGGIVIIPVPRTDASVEPKPDASKPIVDSGVKPRPDGALPPRPTGDAGSVGKCEIDFVLECCKEPRPPFVFIGQCPLQSELVRIAKVLELVAHHIDGLPPSTTKNVDLAKTWQLHRETIAKQRLCAGNTNDTQGLWDHIAACNEIIGKYQGDM